MRDASFHNQKEGDDIPRLDVEDFIYPPIKRKWMKYALLDIKTYLDYYGRTLRVWCTFFWTHPVYEPEKWNDGGTIQYSNNCYNYACNIQTNTYAQPGEAHGVNLLWPDQMQCDPVTNAAEADGLKKLVNQSCGICCHKVALAVWPNMDYHWYRQDKNGKWSHKPGGTEATNLDNSGNPIDDPATADRGNYVDFCGYFCVCYGAVTIQ